MTPLGIRPDEDGRADHAHATACGSPEPAARPDGATGPQPGSKPRHIAINLQYKCRRSTRHIGLLEGRAAETATATASKIAVRHHRPVDRIPADSFDNGHRSFDESRARSGVRRPGSRRHLVSHAFGWPDNAVTRGSIVGCAVSEYCFLETKYIGIACVGHRSIEQRTTDRELIDGRSDRTLVPSKGYQFRCRSVTRVGL